MTNSDSLQVKSGIVAVYILNYCLSLLCMQCAMISIRVFFRAGSCLCQLFFRS